MTKEAIIEILKKVNYPGFNRDIVSFGIVKDVEISNEKVVVDLTIATSNVENRNEIVGRVKSALTTVAGIKEVEVRLVAPKTQTERPTITHNAADTQTLLPEVKYTIAVASGKGGVGKSTVAVNLAAALSKSGYKVGLLDLDIYGPSIPILLGSNEYPKLTPDKKLIPLDAYGMKVMSFGFISGNKTPVIWRGPMVARMTEQFFQDVLWGELDFLILDLPPGTGDIQLTLVQKLKISGAIIVTTPQDLALADVRKGADMFREVNTPVLGVIENMSGFTLTGCVKDGDGNPLKNGKVSFPMMDEALETFISENGKFSIELDLFKKGGGKSESLRLDVPLLAEIPLSYELMEACDAGTPLVIKDSNSKVSEAFLRAAQSIVKSVSAD